MFDRLSDEAQSNPNYFTELADDVRQECSKMGTVLHAAADKWSNGFVYLKLLAHTEAARVKEVMHGRRARRHRKCRATPRAVGGDDHGVRSPRRRYFAKNKIIAEFIEEARYDKKFKLGSVGGAMWG